MYARLTDAAEALLAEPNEQIEAEVAVGRLAEVLQTPGMSPIILHILRQETTP